MTRMMIDTLCIMTGFFAIIAGLILTVYMVTAIPAKVQAVKSAADVRTARIEARADLALQDTEYSEATGEGEDPSGLNGIARLLGYSDVSSALSDPKILSKLTGGNNTETKEA